MLYLQILFWLWSLWLVLILAYRVYLYFREGYGYWSWFVEWAIGVVSAVGIYVVAYSRPIASRWFWCCVLVVVVGSTIYRLQSKRLKIMMEPLTANQKGVVYVIMVVFTLPVLISLGLNVSNYTGLWTLN